jgi:hypothetical protein
VLSRPRSPASDALVLSSRADGLSLGGCSTTRVPWIPPCTRQTRVYLVARNAAVFASPHALLSIEMQCNPPPSGVAHAGFFVWVTGQGVIHAEGAVGLDTWCKTVAAAGAVHRWTHLNMQMLVGDVRGGYNPLVDKTRQQQVTETCQDWYRVRWLQTSDGCVAFPVLDTPEAFTARNPHHGLCEKALKAFVNGTQTKRVPGWRTDRNTLHAVPPRSYHWVRLPAPPADALRRPHIYGLCFADDATRSRVLAKDCCPPPSAQAPHHHHAHTQYTHTHTSTPLP